MGRYIILCRVEEGQFCNICVRNPQFGGDDFESRARMGTSSVGILSKSTWDVHIEALGIDRTVVEVNTVGIFARSHNVADENLLHFETGEVRLRLV